MAYLISDKVDSVCHRSHLRFKRERYSVQIWLRSKQYAAPLSWVECLRVRVSDYSGFESQNLFVNWCSLCMGTANYYGSDGCVQFETIRKVLFAS